ncbi:uncharacterized protein LOC117318893 [Pecten maximus]|uniref:uncharacterized protein LOC117318893 n=1 Tax=Pecten maximus TaxID=6579 RepID=UPI001457F5F2|nr:uncharacterized protein LOC117318893 [Pecten maximus]
MTIHLESVHQKRKFPCSICRKEFAYSNSRLRHERICNSSTTEPASKKRRTEVNLDFNDTTDKKVRDGKKWRPTPAPRWSLLRPKPASRRPIPAPRRPIPAPRRPIPAPRRPTPAPRLSLQTGTSRNANRVTDEYSEGKKGFKCKHCKKSLPNRRQLYLHRQLVHGQHGGSAALQPAPWGDERPPWLDGHDMELERVYRANERFILVPDNPDSVRATFNVPLNDNPDLSQILERVRQIYSQQEHAFRINFMFGLVLRHTETNDLRYFIPDQNETLFPQPILINDGRDIDGKLRRRLDGLDLGEHLRQFRPDSKWKLYFITNMKIVIYKSNYLLGAGVEELPDYVHNNPNICSLTKNSNGRPYNDNLCAFRCLALFRGQRTQLERTTKSLYRQWATYISEREIGDLTHVTPESYAGVNFSEMDDFEKCFETNINIYTLDKDGTATPVRRTMSRYGNTMYVNLFGHHLSYISNAKAYAKKYQCRNCERFFTTAWQCVRHEKSCDKQTSSKYPGGFHSSRTTIFDQLDEFGIVVPQEDRFYPWFAVYDFEALLQQTDETDSGKLQWTMEHVPISVSVCSNVLGFEEAVCLANPDTGELVFDMIERLEKIQETAQALATEKWKYVFEEIDEQLNQWNEYDGLAGKMMLNAFTKLKKSMEQYCSQLIVLGFNSARYDLNLIKKHIAKHLRMDEKETAGFTVKKQNSYLCISNALLKVLDISQFLSPGTSYSKFLKAYDVHETKGFFPYEYLTTTTDKLDETALPPHSEFYSKLKGKNISEEEYAYCQRIWEEEKMQTLQDFLVWYNNLDVGPFVKAVEKLQHFYFDRKIDIFKVAMSVPGVARQMLFRASRDAGASFSLFGESDKDLYSTIKNNVVGGPSIIFNRYSAAGETCIRNKPDKPCGRVLGYDANALYLWALDQPMPTSTFVRRRRENNFHPEARDRYMSAYYWMDWLTRTTGRRIDHKLNCGNEKRIGAFPVDGYCTETNTVFQFQGCYHHGHECHLTRHVKDREGQRKKFEKTTNTTTFLLEKGFTVTEIWECQYRNLVRDCEGLRELINERKPKFFRSHKGNFIAR